MGIENEREPGNARDKSMRDNMGMGIRMGPEGEQGYIANGDTGVRITLEGDKEYGVNVGDPQALVDCVRASRAASDARED